MPFKTLKKYGHPSISFEEVKKLVINDLESYRTNSRVGCVIPSAGVLVELEYRAPRDDNDWDQVEFYPEHYSVDQSELVRDDGSPSPLEIKVIRGCYLVTPFGDFREGGYDFEEHDYPY